MLDAISEFDGLRVVLQSCLHVAQRLTVIANKYCGIKILQDNGDLSCGFFVINLYIFRRRGSSASAAEGSPNGGACHKRFTSHACSIAVCAVFTSPASRATRASGCSLCGFLFDLFFAKA